MQTQFVAQQPVDDFGQKFSGLKYSAKLPATTVTSLVVPGVADEYKAIMRSQDGEEVFAGVNATAAVPAAPTGNSLNVSTCEMIPPQGLCRYVYPGDTLSFITRGTDVDLTVVIYPIYQL